MSPGARLHRAHQYRAVGAQDSEPDNLRRLYGLLDSDNTGSSLVSLSGIAVNGASPKGALRHADAWDRVFHCLRRWSRMPVLPGSDTQYSGGLEKV